MKQLKDYLHLYLGCEVEDKIKGIGVLDSISKTHCQVDFGKTIDGCFFDDIKPLLRPLSDMTEEEHEQWKEIKYNENRKLKPYYTDADYNAFHWLLSKHFDLFNLIEENLAIDKSKQP